jgi:hypothetical protein
LILNDESQRDLIEQLLIGLLGMQDIRVRDHAIKLLNILYDRVDWQLVFLLYLQNNPFKSKISCVGDQFEITYLIEYAEYIDDLILLLNSPCFHYS